MKRDAKRIGIIGWVIVVLLACVSCSTAVPTEKTPAHFSSIPPLAPGLPVPGFISVSSSPSGAGISLDGRPINAITPHTINVEVLGTHTIKLSLEGYQEWSTTLEVKAGFVASCKK